MTLIAEWKRLSAQLDSQDAQVIARLVESYGRTYENIIPEIEALTEWMESQEVLTAEAVKKSAAYKNLIVAIGDELDAYEGYLVTEARTATDAAARAGLSAGAFLLLVALADVLGVSVKDVPREMVASAPPDALSFLAGYLEKMKEKINMLSNYHAEAISAGILERVGLGVNPKIIAAWITDAYGVGLTDAMRMMRTAQLYAYREANNLLQIANSDVLQGVVWSAELDSLVCMSCVSLHGQVFPVGTLCNDHHLGRCTMLPWVRGADNPISQTGEEWFALQSPETQRGMMGQSKYEAWTEGKFTFDQLSAVYENDIFGQMRGEASLKSIIGEGEE